MPFLLSFAAWPSAAQSPDTDAVRWAVSVDGFSTAFGRKAYGPQQVLGPPEAWPRTEHVVVQGKHHLDLIEAMKTADGALTEALVGGL